MYRWIVRGLKTVLRREFIRLNQTLSAEALDCIMIGSARVTEKKKGFYDKKADEVKGADPSWMELKYYPAMDGWARDYIGHYYQLVTYMDQDIVEVKDEQSKKRVNRPAYRLFMQPGGDYWVKNVWSHLWTYPDPLENMMFDDVFEKLNTITKEEEASGKPADSELGRDHRTD